MYYYADKNEVHVIISGGGAFVPLLSTWTRGGVVKCPRLSTQGGEGVKIGQNLVHVIVECPLIRGKHSHSGEPVTHGMYNRDKYCVCIGACTMYIQKGFAIIQGKCFENQRKCRFHMLHQFETKQASTHNIFHFTF